MVMMALEDKTMRRCGCTIKMKAWQCIGRYNRGRRRRQWWQWWCRGGVWYNQGGKGYDTRVIDQHEKEVATWAIQPGENNEWRACVQSRLIEIVMVHGIQLRQKKEWQYVSETTLGKKIVAWTIQLKQKMLRACKKYTNAKKQAPTWTRLVEVKTVDNTWAIQWR